MTIDPALSLALSVHAHKGVYAVLVGSGLSKSAGIPTGDEVVIDLIRRIATADGAEAGDSPKKWYSEKYKKEATYSDLIEMLAPTSEERMSLLRGYFEPTEDEMDKGSKVPTKAHHAIARLAARGYIKVIVTTNFDKLLERAIDAQGIAPTVVATPDQILGMMPLQHVTTCLVIKVHGDYLDTRIKNTTLELGIYDDATKLLLDRVFADYGLIVCGWSGEYDVALSDAIIRNTRYRFSTYWLARSGKVAELAKPLVAHRNAMVVPIESADAGFVDLEARVDALESQRIADPISPRLAVAMMKRFLSEDKYRIQLEDLFMGELVVVRNALDLRYFPVGSPVPDETNYPERVEQMEVICSKLIPMAATGVYWGTSMLDPLWVRALRFLSHSEFASGSSHPAWDSLQYYPVTLVVYAIGMTAILKRRFELIKLLLVDTKSIQNRGGPEELSYQIGAMRALHSDTAQFLHNRNQSTPRLTPGSDWMVVRMRPMMVEVLGEDVDFEGLFDEFEFLFALIAIHASWGLYTGRFAWRQHRFSQKNLCTSLAAELKTLGLKHPLILAGFFEGSVERMEKALSRVEEMTSRMR